MTWAIPPAITSCPPLMIIGAFACASPVRVPQRCTWTCPPVSGLQAAHVRLCRSESPIRQQPGMSSLAADLLFSVWDTGHNRIQTEPAPPRPIARRGQSRPPTPRRRHLKITVSLGLPVVGLVAEAYAWRWQRDPKLTGARGWNGWPQAPATPKSHLKALPRRLTIQCQPLHGARARQPSSSAIPDPPTRWRAECPVMCGHDRSPSAPGRNALGG